MTSTVIQGDFNEDRIKVTNTDRENVYIEARDANGATPVRFNRVAAAQLRDALDVFLGADAPTTTRAETPTTGDDALERRKAALDVAVQYAADINVTTLPGVMSIARYLLGPNDGQGGTH